MLINNAQTQLPEKPSTAIRLHVLKLLSEKSERLQNRHERADLVLRGPQLTVVASSIATKFAKSAADWELMQEHARAGKSGRGAWRAAADV